MYVYNNYLYMHYCINREGWGDCINDRTNDSSVSLVVNIRHIRTINISYDFMQRYGNRNYSVLTNLH